MGHPSHHAADASRVPQSGELGFAARPLCAPNHVHAPLFPFERTEQWMVLLVDVKANKLVGYQKLSQNSRFETVNLKFLAPKEAPPVSFLTRAPPCLYLLSLLPFRYYWVALFIVLYLWCLLLFRVLLLLFLYLRLLRYDLVQVLERSL